MRCACYDASGVDTRHARICPRARAQVIRHQPLLHATSRAVKRLGIPCLVESGKPTLAGSNPRKGMVVRRRGFRDARSRRYRDKSAILDVTHVNLQAQVRLRGGMSDHDGSATSASEASKPQHYARPGHVCLSTSGVKNLPLIAVESSGRLEAEGSHFIDQLAV